MNTEFCSHEHNSYYLYKGKIVSLYLKMEKGECIKKAEAIDFYYLIYFSRIFSKSEFFKSSVTSIIPITISSLAMA